MAELTPTIIRRRKILELADELGNVSEACRRAGISRATFYEWKRRMRYGTTAWDLGPKSRAPKNRPAKKPKHFAWLACHLARKHPTWGCRRIAKELTRRGYDIGATAVHSFLARNRLASRDDRLRELEASPIDRLTPEQLETLFTFNPRIRDVDHRGRRFGEVLAQGFLKLPAESHTSGFVHAIVDTWSCWAWVAFSGDVGDELKAAIRLLRQVVTTLQAHNVHPGRIIAPEIPVFTDQRYIESARSWSMQLETVSFQQTGFVEAFGRDLVAGSGESNFALSSDLAAWVDAYNARDSIEGFPLRGASPLDWIKERGTRGHL